MKFAVTATPSAGRFAPIILRGDPAQAFALAARLGYNGVELHLRNPSDIDRAAVKRLMKRYRLAVPTIGTGMAAGEDGLTFASDDQTIRQQAVARVLEHIALAAELGSAVIIGLIWGRVGTEPHQRARRLEAAQTCLVTCYRAAQEAGVRLLFEAINHRDSDYPNTLSQAIEVIEAIGAQDIRLLADTFHMSMEEHDMIASLRGARSYLGHIHLVDSDRQPPGQGRLDLRSVVATLREIGYEGYLAFEVLPQPSPEQAAESAIRTVRSYLDMG